LQIRFIFFLGRFTSDVVALATGCNSLAGAAWTFPAWLKMKQKSGTLQSSGVAGVWTTRPPPDRPAWESSRPPPAGFVQGMIPEYSIERDCPVDKQLLGGTGRAATSSARVGAGATKTKGRRHKIPSPDAALGDGVFAARKPPPLFVNRIIPQLSMAKMREGAFSPLQPSSWPSQGNNRPDFILFAEAA
jgi:hypothetical protein